ncbi:MAG: PQQ-binding-like beta-propeller repeat protein [Planctomycetes bacterium]|nr:PQQ-binding-like beta-propeller repeat protein [Planctomycetota bacterium]
MSLWFNTFLWAVVCLLLCDSANAAEWPRFRGPNGEGHAPAVEVPDKWTEQDYRWKADLPGIGHSSPVISGKLLVVTSAEADKSKLYVLAYDAQSGQRKWQTELESPPLRMHARNSGATSTPAIDAAQVYVTGIGPKGYFVVALSLADGHEAWRKELGPFAAQHGFGPSPILHRDTLIVPNDQDGESFVLALDSATGKERWRAARRSGRASYSAPCVYEPAGRKPELILTSPDNGMTGLDMETGNLNWSLDVFPERTVGSPVVAGDLILANCGKGNGGHSLVAVRPPLTPDGKAELVYTLTNSVPYVPTPVVRDNLLFLIHDMGLASCHELATGKRLWNKRLGGNFSGSPVLVGDRLFAMTNDGEVVVLAAERQFKEPTRTPLGQTSRATPAVALGHIYLRTQSKLFCLGGAAKVAGNLPVP